MNLVILVMYIYYLFFLITGALVNESGNSGDVYLLFIFFRAGGR